ncbi:hypothetical protein PVAP13_1KG278715 [Panicum virgatum]|uniref:Uncharacterized protein n=1 Tax=Panicum virgatum TaxID=38727 RepID=A0A8T0XRP4_PANVG|nr:hypothetical protein PVAP13_1KG278715 [Panicum virgatum]
MQVPENFFGIWNLGTKHGLYILVIYIFYSNLPYPPLLPSVMSGTHPTLSLTRPIPLSLLPCFSSAASGGAGLPPPRVCPSPAAPVFLLSLAGGSARGPAGRPGGAAPMAASSSLPLPRRADALPPRLPRRPGGPPPSLRLPSLSAVLVDASGGPWRRRLDPPPPPSLSHGGVGGGGCGLWGAADGPSLSLSLRSPPLPARPPPLAPDPGVRRPEVAGSRRWRPWSLGWRTCGQTLRARGVADAARRGGARPGRRGGADAARQRVDAARRPQSGRGAAAGRGNRGAVARRAAALPAAPRARALRGRHELAARRDGARPHPRRAPLSWSGATRGGGVAGRRPGAWRGGAARRRPGAWRGGAARRGGGGRARRGGVGAVAATTCSNSEVPAAAEALARGGRCSSARRPWGRAAAPGLDGRAPRYVAAVAFSWTSPGNR